MTSLLPGFIIAPLAGAYIDRWPRRPILILSDLTRGLPVVILAGLAFWQQIEIWQVFTVAIIISLGSTFFDPTVQTVILQIVSLEEIPKANSLSQIIGGISSVMGPLLGALAVSFFGVSIVILFNGLSYLISAICMGLIKIPAIAKKSPANRSPWNDLLDGLNYLKKQKKSLIIIAIIGLAHFFIGSLLVALPFLAKKLDGNGVQNLGYLETMMGMGLILGSIIISFRKKERLRDFNLFLFLVLAGFCYILIGLIIYLKILNVFPYLGLMLLLGVLIANASIYWQSLLQFITSNEMAGRVFSISNMIGNVSLPIAFGIFGLLLNFSFIGLLLGLSGASLMVLSGLLLIGYRQSGSC